MGNNYEEMICNAIEVIVNNKVKNASYSSTVKASIVQCLDKNLGKYKVRYQDSTFTAYALNPYVEYRPDFLVYVFIPNNDFDESKFIIEAVDPVGAKPFPESGGGEITPTPPSPTITVLKGLVTDDNDLELYTGESPAESELNGVVTLDDELELFIGNASPAYELEKEISKVLTEIIGGNA